MFYIPIHTSHSHKHEKQAAERFIMIKKTDGK